MPLFRIEARLPFVFLDTSVFSTNSALLEAHKGGMLHLQHQLNSFFERRQMLIRTVHKFRSSKQLSNDRSRAVTLCKELGNLHLLLSHLLMSYAETLATLEKLDAAEVTNMSDTMTAALQSLRSQLAASSSRDREQRPEIASSAKAQDVLVESVASQQTRQARALLHGFRERWMRQAFGESEDDDLDVLVLFEMFWFLSASYLILRLLLGNNLWACRCWN